MKKSLIVLMTVLAAAGCVSKEQMPHETAVRTPIMPIRYTGANMEAVLTDYVPWIDSKTEPTIVTDEHYSAVLTKHGQCAELTGDNTLSYINVRADGQQWDVAVLPSLPAKQGLSTTSFSGNTVEVAIYGQDATKMTICAFADNTALPQENITAGEDGRSWQIRLPEGDMEGRHFLRVYAATEDNLYNDLLVPLHDGKPVTDTNELNRHDDQSQVLYSVLVDRFFNGNKNNDWKLNSPEVLDIVDYQGGDLAGITQKIRDGFFDELGVTTLWISPITQNPWDAWGCYRFQETDSGRYNNKYDQTKAYTKFTGYHGYWPLFVTSTDKRFGTDEELRTLLKTAHAHRMNVVLDYVANHMHIESPTLREHPDWHTDSLLPDGRRNFELWDEARLTTWFDVHIPTLDLEREEVYMPMTDSALYWLENFDFDGFRHDACKHIPECYWRTLTHKAAMRYPDRHIWMIGETYGSPELINKYVKTGMLNAQFDFNVYFTLRDALIGKGSMKDVDRVIRESIATYGAHHTMGNISGNHDQARFASVAGGAISTDEDAKEAGWTREVGIGDAKTAHRRAITMEMINMTIPGVPCIYQGDEYAETGGNDPDNRHPMRFENLSETEKKFRSKVQELIKIRRQSMPLMYGEYVTVEADADRLVFDRIYMGDSVRVTADRNGQCSIEHKGEKIWEL